MTNGPLYIIERWPHGWVICSPPMQARGVPMNALSECCPLSPKTAVMDQGICNHLRESGASPNAVMVIIPTKADGKAWRGEIEESLSYGKDAEVAWFTGTDTGLSSKTIFGVLASNAMLRFRVLDSGMYEPSDGDDFGRCQRLVDMMGWRERLPEVAEKYPDSKWPAIIARWDEIKSAIPSRQYEILKSISE